MRNRDVNRCWRTSALAVLCLLLAANMSAVAQENGQQAGASGQGAAAPEEGGHEEAAEASASQEGEDEGIALNLNKVKIDKLIKFLTDTTGKSVVKHKDVDAEVTVFSPTKVSREEALALISEALMLQKVAVVEHKDSIKLIPAELLSDAAIGLLPGGGLELPTGMIREVIPIRFADAEEIEAIVKPLLSKNGLVMAHPASKKIIVTDQANRVANVKDVIGLLDVLDTDERRVKIFPLDHADAEVIAPILKTVLSVLAQREAGGASGGQPPQGQPQPQPQPQKKPQSGGSGGALLDVLPYKEANWIVLVAPQEIVAAAEPLVAQLDRDRPQALSLRVLPIKFANPEEVARQLMPLFEKRPEKRVEDTVQITAHDRSSSLVVLSSEANFQVIEEIVSGLDTEESVQMMTKTYELEYADASDIAEQMTELYSGLQDTGYRDWWGGWYGGRSSSQEKTRFVPERRTNSVIAITRPTEIAKIDELIAKLDKPIDTEQVAPRIFHLTYVDAKETTDVLNKIFGVEDSESTGGYYDYLAARYGGDDAEVGRLYGKVKFVAETSTNSIIVTTNNRENFTIIEDFIHQLDKFNPEAANTIVITLRHAKARDVADELNALFAEAGARMPSQQRQQGEDQEEQERQSFLSWLYGSPKKDEERPVSNLIGRVRMVPDVRTNSLTITTAVQNFELLRELIERLDAESPKVLIKVRLIEVTTTRAQRVGTRYSSDPSVFETDDLDNGLQSTFGASWQDVYHDGTISANADIDISLLVQFLRRHADTRILSEPTLAMNNNEEGKIFVGSRIPFITNSQTSAEGSLTQSFEYRDAGTTLTITPNINEFDRVEMKVKLESSQIRPGEVLFGGFILDTREFDTELAVETGDTIVVGGIMRESESEAVRRVPILGYIPVVNLVFKKRDTKRETTELIAFITPTVLRSTEADAAVTRESADRVDRIQNWRRLPEVLDDLNAPRRAWWKRLLGIGPKAPSVQQEEAAVAAGTGGVVDGGPSAANEGDDHEDHEG